MTEVLPSIVARAVHGICQAASPAAPRDHVMTQCQTTALSHGGRGPSRTRSDVTFRSRPKHAQYLGFVAVDDLVSLSNFDSDTSYDRVLRQSLRSNRINR
jgi:hypothetical protein